MNARELSTRELSTRAPFPQPDLRLETRNFRLAAMHRNILFAIALALPLLLVACAGGDGERASMNGSNAPGASNSNASQTSATPPSQDVVTVSASETEIRAGGEAEAEIRLDIADGFHVNANPPSDKFYIGTEVEAQAEGGVTPGRPIYPPAVTQKFEFSEKPLAVYEGEAVIKLPLKADGAAEKGRRKLRARVRVQPCNDRECFPPRTLETELPVTVN